MDADASMSRFSFKGGAPTSANIATHAFPGGVRPPRRTAPGLGPDPAAPPGGRSLQAKTSQRVGRHVRRVERENGPAAPSGGSVRDKEKP